MQNGSQQPPGTYTKSMVFHRFCTHFDHIDAVWRQLDFGFNFLLQFWSKFETHFGSNLAAILTSKSIDFLIDFWKQFGPLSDTTLSIKKRLKKVMIFRFAFFAKQVPETERRHFDGTSTRLRRGHLQPRCPLGQLPIRA